MNQITDIQTYWHFQDNGDGSSSVSFFPSYYALLQEFLDRDDELTEATTFAQLKSWCEEDTYERGTVGTSVIKVDLWQNELARGFTVSSD